MFYLIFNCWRKHDICNYLLFEQRQLNKQEVILCHKRYNLCFLGVCFRDHGGKTLKYKYNVQLFSVDIILKFCLKCSKIVYVVIFQMIKNFMTEIKYSESGPDLNPGCFWLKIVAKFVDYKKAPTMAVRHHYYLVRC